MALVAHLSKEDFLAWIGRKFDPLPSVIYRDEVPVDHEAFVSLVWRDADNLSDTQVVMAVRPDQARDFYAFVNTYVSEARPFSSVHKVIVTDSLKLEEPNYSMQQSSERYPFIGMAVCEAFYRGYPVYKDANSVSVPSVKSTLSAALYSASFHSNDYEIEKVVERWVGAQTVLNVETRSPAPSEEILIPWQIAFDWKQGGTREAANLRDLRRLVAEIRIRRSFDSDDWLVLSEGLPELRNIYKSMRGPREDRIAPFRKAIDTLETFPRLPPFRRAALAGYLLALLGDGSFQFLPLSASFDRDIRLASIWFGLWTSLFPSSDAMRLSGGIFRKAAQDLAPSRRLFDNVDYDISLDELFLMDERIVSSLVKIQDGLLKVSILPSLVCHIRNRKAEDRDRSFLGREDVSRIRSYTSRILDLLDGSHEQGRFDFSDRNESAGKKIAPRRKKSL